MLSFRPALLLGLLSAIGCSVAAREEPAATESESDLTLAELPVRLTDIAAGTFDQAVDHEATDASLGTFKQRYWYSTQFAKGATPPVLFYFCPESECNAGHLTLLADSAKVLGAAVVALEHRYYGKSLPFANPTLAQMKYLTMHNALEDVASFQGFATTQLGLRGKWIAVGGSYAGMLAAFYREKHPELVVGAWASSAPVDMQESFWGYDLIAAQALGPACTALFRQALDEVTAAFDDDAKRNDFSMRAFKRPYPLPADLDPASRAYLKATFTEQVSNPVMGAAQYGNTIQVCSALAQHAERPIEGIIGYLNPPLVSEPTDPPPPPPGPQPPEGAYRAGAWFYQTCTEVGFFRVPNPNEVQSIMSDLITVEHSRLQCGWWVQQQPRLAETREKYLKPILDGRVSNLYFVNGQLDPWAALSFNDQASAPPGVTTKVVALGSHCTDLMNLTKESTLGVFEAHKEFNTLAKQWLAQ